MANYGKYKTPTDLMLDKSLSKVEKINKLKQWLEDEESLSRAAQEGMIGSGQSDTLKQVNKALIALEENEN